MPGAVAVKSPGRRGERRKGGLARRPRSPRQLWGSREPDGELSSAGDPRLGWGVGLGVESGTATRPSTNQEARSEVRDVPVDGRRGSPILSAVLKPPKGSTSPTFPHTFAHQATLPLAHGGVQPAARGVLTRPPTRHA